MFKKYKRNVLITGASSGIGAACVIKHVKYSDRVIAVARDKKKFLESISSYFNKDQIEFIECDFSDIKNIKDLFVYVKERYGFIDIAINSAGVEGTPFTKITDYSLDTWLEVLQINLTATWLCVKEEICLMLKRKNPVSIINVSSLAGLYASFSGGTGYTASKHGVIGLTRSVAKEYSNSNLRVNAVCPGMVDTPMYRKVLSSVSKKEKERIMLEPVCTAVEVADIIFWLSSKYSSSINGSAIEISNGKKIAFS